MGEESGATGKPYPNLVGRRSVCWGEVQDYGSGWQTLPVKDQIVNVSVFSGHMISVATTSSCHSSAEVAWEVNR